MKREDLAGALFDADLVIPGRTNYAFHVEFDKLSRHELCEVFIDDLIETFKLEQNQHLKNLGLIFNTHISKDLVKIISKRLNVEYSEFNPDTCTLCSCMGDLDYVFMGYCISRGTSLHDAEIVLNNLHENSHIVSGLYFLDRQRWQETLQGRNIGIYSTLNWNDLTDACQFSNKK